MMLLTFAIQVVVMAFDPLMLAACVGVGLFARQAWVVMLSAIGIGFFFEIVVAANYSQYGGFEFGDSLFPRILSAELTCFICYGIRRLIPRLSKYI